MNCVALTGATGYVGGIIADGLAPATEIVRLSRLLAREQDIAWALDRPPTGLVDALRQRGADSLLHAAWDMSTSSPETARRVSIDGSLALLRAAREAGVTRVVFISTISAFDGARSVYGRSKREVETAVLADGGIVLRLGLVHGDRNNGGDGGMFGTIRRAVIGGRLVPMIGSGRGPQYLLDATRLQSAIRRALAGDLDAISDPITLADDNPIAFRDLVLRIAHDHGRRPILVPVPWRLLHFGLSSMERVGLAPAVRSDSVTSFVHSNPAPDFASAKAARL